MMKPVPTEETDLEVPKSLGDLFWSFSVLALQGFGGVAAVAQRELVERKRWLSRQGFLEDWAVAQILPGPNVVNLAVMIGDRHRGIPGAIAAAAGMCLIPLTILLILAMFFASVSHLPEVKGALRGMGIAVAALIVQASIKLVPALRKHPAGLAACILFGVATFVAIAIMHWPLVGVLLGIGGISCVWTYLRLQPTAVAAAAEQSK